MNNKKNSSNLAELLIDVIPKAMQSIRSEMRQGRGDQLTVPQFRVLAAVSRGIKFNRELGEHLGVSEAAVSRMVDVLVKDGLIKKNISKTDRRQSLLTLSSEGQKLYNSIKLAGRDRLKLKLEALSQDDVEALLVGLKVLQDHLVLLEI